jgi:hypothetical protein
MLWNESLVQKRRPNAIVLFSRNYSMRLYQNQKEDCGMRLMIIDLLVEF